jgi:hypothetical protein
MVRSRTPLNLVRRKVSPAEPPGSTVVDTVFAVLVSWDCLAGAAAAVGSTVATASVEGEGGAGELLLLMSMSTNGG